MPRHISLRVTAAAPAGPDLRRLTLQDPDGYELPPTVPGAHVDLHIPGLGLRSYSLCGDPAVADRWNIAVKREAGSRGGSIYLYDTLAVGESVAANMPRCTFPLAAIATTTRHIMIAGGIGVTPFLSMAPVLARAGADWTLHLLHRGAPPCRADLAPYLATGNVVLHDTAAATRPDLNALLGRPTPGTQAYCCGPFAMLAAFDQATAEWPPGTARTEHFTAPPLPADPNARSYTLVRASTGQTQSIAAGGSLLDALRSLGADVPSSCEGGICGACEVRWLEGEPVHRDRILPAARRATHLMACVAGCASDRLVIDA